MHDLYCELSDRKLLRDKMEEYLADYNIRHPIHMDIVLFLDAIEHVVKVVRVISMGQGHCLMVGVGGSGRKSLV